jgi:type IV pilus assembly protein PilA
MRITPSISRNWWLASRAAGIAAMMLVGAGTCRAQGVGIETPESPISQEMKKYPGLTEEFGKLLQRVIAELKYPEGRKESRLLPVLPETTMSYAAFSNYGETSSQILKIFREELRESEPLRKWWGSGEMATSGPKIEAFLERFSQFEEYVGDEMTFCGAFAGKEPKFLIVAEIRKPGLKAFLEQWTAELGEKGKPAGRVVDAQGLAGMKESGTVQDLVFVVRSDYLVAGDNVTALREFTAQLDKKNGKFASTAFGQRVAKAYEGGTTILAAADLQKILSTTMPTFQPGQTSLNESGFGDMKYAVWEHTGAAGAEVSKAELSFTGPRHGIASWLGKQRPLNSLDFVSPKAILAVTLGLKDPAKIYDEAKEMAAAVHADTFAAVPTLEQALNINLRDDVLGELGGELTLEVDTLPPAMPVWRAILKVKDAAHLQKTLSTLFIAMNIAVKRDEAEGAATYSFRAPNGMPISYAMLDGYLIVGSRSEAVAESVRGHKSGESLAKSKTFLASLPPGRTTEASGMFYEDPGAVAALQFGRLMPGLASAWTGEAQGKQAATMWAYGDESAIREESASGPFDVGGVLVVAAIAIPNLVKSKMAANEATAVGSLRTVVTAQIAYFTENPLRGFAPNLATLGPNPDGSMKETPQHANLIDGTLGGAKCTANEWCVKSGYRFQITASCKQRKCSEFVVEATPVSSSTGTRSFCVTSDGVIRFKAGEPMLEMITAAECKRWAALQ